ncbi:MAG: phosphoserine phosphatase SerB [Microthrixaceae bacterium]|nr:phosphoserine phosphatase SerB [Microthrixaceae bacterium]
MEHDVPVGEESAPVNEETLAQGHLRATVAGAPGADEHASGPADQGDRPTAALLVRVTGRDRPGITADLMTLLDLTGTGVQDLEQVLVRGHLTLAVAVDHPGERRSDLVTMLEHFARQRHLTVTLEEVPATSGAQGPLDAITVLGHELETELSPAELGAVAGAVSAAGGNIERIVRLARYPVYAYEFLVRGAQRDELQRLVTQASVTHRLDVAIQPAGLERRAKRLVVLDVDSTLIQDEVIELLAEEAGCRDEVHMVTERAMAGELDFAEALRERVRLLEGLDEAALLRARARMRLTPGARTFVSTLKRLGYTVGIVSGGFTRFTDHLRAELGLDHAVANELLWHEGRLTGEVAGRIVDRARKAELLTEFAAKENIPLSQTVAVGDGANDLDMLSTAGLGIAFNAKPVVQEVADTTVNVPYLDAILFVLGVRRGEVEAVSEDTATGN